MKKVVFLTVRTRTYVVFNHATMAYGGLHYYIEWRFVVYVYNRVKVQIAQPALASLKWKHILRAFEHSGLGLI